MSDQKKISDLYLKVAGLERRINKLEGGMQELDNVVDPQGWIGEAFERLEDDLSEMKGEMLEIRREMNQFNSKIDIILKHITGMSDHSN
jgi:predicted  nucleic acid-binding Zn-ribbon protein